MRPPSTKSRLVVLAGAAALTLAGCTSASVVLPDEGVPLSPLPRPIVEASAAALEQRGEILDRRDLAASIAPVVRDRAAFMVSARYRSTSGLTGQPTDVSGAFFAPKGDPPPGGWPVIALAHGTTGVQHDCGLSGTPDLRGFADGVGSLLTAGYAVAATDYTGLGGIGDHPYLEPRTAAHDVIDSVRALRRLLPQVSETWVAIGASQGGQAAWAVAEQNARYGSGMRLLGAVALAPAADLSPMAVLARNRTLSADGVALMPMVVAGLVRAYGLDVRSILHGAARDPVVLGCGSAAARARAGLRSVDVAPVTDGDAVAVRDLLRANALPQQRAEVPLLVVYGDDDDIVRPAWVETAAGRACRLGTPMSIRRLSGAGHAQVVPDAEVMEWIAARFHGVEMIGNCWEGTE